MLKVMLIFLLPLVCLAAKKVEYRLSRNYGQLVYDFSGNNHHSSNGNSVSTLINDGIFTDRGFYINSSACAIPLTSNTIMAFPNPGTVLVWARTSGMAGRFIHQYIDENNSIYYRKGLSNTISIMYNFNSATKNFANGPTDSFLSNTWVMISVVISGRYITVSQNLSPMVTLDNLINYTQNYRMVIGSCTGSPVTNSFIYYFVVFDSDSIQNSYFGGASSNCLTGSGTCASCSYSVYLDYMNTTGCISESASTTSDAYGNTCLAGNTCREGLTLKCLCSSLSCYFNSSSFVECINYSTGVLTQTASSCSDIGQGCCNSVCYECSQETSCISCVSSNAFVDTDGLCSCKDGFYGSRPLTSTNSCSSCKSECSKCLDSSSCTTCLASNSSPSGSGCSCNEGYYSTGVLTSNDSCHACNSDCKTCTNSSTCSSCISLYSKVSDVGCVCNDGYWGQAPLSSLNSCFQCNSDCLTCNNSTNCLTCKSEHSIPSTYGCKCEAGYWGLEPLTSTNSCQKCGDECLKCSNSSMCSECLSTNAEATTSGCICKNGYYSAASGALLDINSCQKCGDECLKCTNSSMCSECLSTNADATNLGCICKTGYYSTTSGALLDINSCQRCGDECLKCTNSSMCSECLSTNAEATNSGCICKTGYYSTGSGALVNINSCQKCGDECLKCTNSSMCSECLSTNADATTSGCICKTGYYSTDSEALVNTNSCQKCGDECLKCTNSSMCSECLSTNAEATNLGCICKTGYYSTGSGALVYINSCQKCGDECLKCTNSSMCSECLSTNAEATTSGCICKTGYYSTTSGALLDINYCQKCDDECLKCTNSSMCSECLSTNAEATNSGCICKTGYYSTGLGSLVDINSCQKCGDECLKCTNSSMCSECLSTNADATTSGCICKAGYYSLGAKTSVYSCIKCKDECFACSSGSSCDECIALNSKPNDTSCECLTGFYSIDTMADINSCKKCGDECSTCSNSSACITCISQNSKPNSNGCICVDKYWNSTPLNAYDSCKPCNQECLKCSNSSSCIQCIALNSEVIDLRCVCKEGFWGNSPLILEDSCIPCNSDCLKCTNSSACTICKSNNSENTAEGCVCKTGYFPLGPLTTLNSCIKCKEECLSCSSLLSCDSCVALNSIPSNQSCSCISNYFASGPMSDPNTCQQCGLECLTCQSSSSCETCRSLNASPFSSGCKCNIGFYSSTSLISLDSCIPCSPECLSCTDLTTCIKCLADNSEATLSGCICKKGYFGTLPLIAKNSCTQCDSSCLSCSDLNFCTGCLDPNSELINGACQCLEGFFVYGKISLNNPCKKCPDGCLKCNEMQLCSSCVNSILILEGGKCVCYQGYYLDMENSNEPCAKCMEFCVICNDFSNCLECDERLELVEGKCFCREEFWMDVDDKNGELCKPCGYGCKSCSQKDYCYECKSFNAIETNGICLCKSGYFNSTKSPLDPCEACQPSCKTCENSESCSECKDPNAIPHQTSCLCKDGYWSDINSASLICRNCSESCEKCLNLTFCISCLPPKLLASGKCIDSCPLNCSRCTENGTCIECIDSKALVIPSLNSCRCKPGFYKSSDSIQSCQTCMDLCELCSDLNSCEKCIFNSELKSNECHCKKGFIKSKNSCIQVFFSMSPQVSTSNKVSLKFSENLKKKILSSDIQVKIKTSSRFGYRVFMKSKVETYISLTFSESISEGSEMVLTFTSPVLSLNGSLLDRMIYNLSLHQVDFIDPSLVLLLENTKALAQGAAISSVSTSFSNPGSLWILINTLQLLIYLPLSSAKLTPAMKAMCRNMADFNIAPNLLLFVLKNDTSFNLTRGMIDSGIDSGDFWINYGEAITIFIGFIGLWPVFAYLSKVNVKWIRKRSEKLKKDYKFGFFLRFWIQGYLELGIFCLIQITRLKSSTKSSHNEWQVYLNQISSNIFMVFVVVTPLVQSIFLWLNIEKILNIENYQEFNDRYGTMFFEFYNARGLAGMIYYPLFSFRNLAYVLCQILLKEHHTVQMAINSFLSLLFLIYLLRFLPFKDKVNMISNILSEVTILVCFIVVLFSGAFQMSEMDVVLEKIFCWMVFGFLIINSVVVLYNMGIFIRDFWFTHEKDRAIKFAKEFHKKNPNWFELNSK